MVNNRVQEVKIEVNGDLKNYKAFDGEALEFTEREGILFIKNVSVRKQPPMGKGWKPYEHPDKRWKDEIFALDSYGNILFWLPIEQLTNNKTQYEHFVKDGFDKQYGRITWMGERFSLEEYNEKINQKVINAVERYGGRWITIYEASRGNGGKPCFTKGKDPWTCISFYDSVMCLSLLDTDEFSYTLPNGADWDCISEYISIKGYNVMDSSEYGNYADSPDSPHKIIPTGSCERFETCGICDLAGNVKEWTTEKFGSALRVLRGGSYDKIGLLNSICIRTFEDPSKDNCLNVGFRAVLLPKHKIW